LCEVHRCEIPKTLNVESLLRTEFSATSVWQCVQNFVGKVGEANPDGNTHGKAIQGSTKVQMG